jgi:hypothetical protein
LGLLNQPDMMLVRSGAVSSAAFDHVIACCLYCRWEAKKLAVGGKRVLQQQRKIEKKKKCDEELLITGVSVSEENQRVLNDGVSASWMK